MAANEREEIEDTVYKIFDDLQNALESKKKFHPSEEFGRIYRNSGGSFDAQINVNNYHFYCAICDEHLYSKSVLNDINSFFQKHVNTTYHKSNKVLNACTNKPIFKWERWLCTGYCNICEMSGIHAYITKTSFNTSKLESIHYCKYDKQLVDNYFKFLKKTELLKLYCSLSFFVDKFLESTEGGTVCYLCMEKFCGTPDKVRYHLATDRHFTNFCSLVNKNFYFSIKDLLNGFNLEIVTRWILKQNFKQPCKNTEVINDKEKCFHSSNNIQHIYSDHINYSGFSPMFVENLLTDGTDLVFNDLCLLCNEKISDVNHMTHKPHLLTTDDLSLNDFKDLKMYQIYLNNRATRLEPYKKLIEDYREIELELNTFGLKIGMEYEPDLENVILNSVFCMSLVKKPKNSHVKYFLWEVSDTVLLVNEKVMVLKNVFFESLNGELFCEFCEQVIPQKFKALHVTRKNHEAEVRKWNEVIIKLEDPNFLKPLRKIKTEFACFACKTSFGAVCLFSHLKGGQHSRKVSSISDPSQLTIWSNFNFMSDYSCYCKICDTQMNVDTSVSTIKTTIENIINHWPCSNKPDNKVEKTDGGRNTTEIQNGILEVSNYTSKASPTSNTFNFVDLKNTLKKLTDVFEDKIIEHVKNNSALSVKSSKKNNSEKSKEINGTISDKENTPEVSESTTVTDNDSTLHLTVSTYIGETSEESSPKYKEFNGQNIKDNSNLSVVEKKLTEVTNRTSEQNNESPNLQKTNPSKETSKKEEQNSRNNYEEEILLSDVPKEKSIRKQICSWLNKFGKIKYLLYKDNNAVVAFITKGTAEEVAKKQVIPIGKDNIKMTFVLRKDNEKEMIKCPPLNPVLSSLFKNPQLLMDFTLELMSQSSKVSKSPEEKIRETRVCSTIILALTSTFPRSKCYLFGSRLTGLTLSNSDLDVFLDWGDMFDGLKTPRFEKRNVNEVARALWGSRECKELVVVANARVPIISFQHSTTKLHCDLSFKNGLSVQNTLLLRYLISLDLRIQPIILMLKRWADFTRLHGPPYFSSYAIALLVIFFLQQQPCPVLPTIESLKKNFTGPRMTIGGWDCNFSTDTSLVPKNVNSHSLPKLLLEFFKFYSCFDYSKYVISPLTGEPLPRAAFSNSSDLRLPMSIKRHILNIPAPIKNLVQPGIAICIMDPFDLSHILTKGFPNRALGLFVHFCKKSAEHLEKSLAAADKVSEK